MLMAGHDEHDISGLHRLKALSDGDNAAAGFADSDLHTVMIMKGCDFALREKNGIIDVDSVLKWDTAEGNGK